MRMTFLLLVTLICFSRVIHANVIEEERLKKEVSDIIAAIPGWCSKEKAKAFIDLVLEVNPDICVEIGVFGGASLFPVASALKYLGHGTVVGIDPWDKFECIRNYDPVQNKPHIKWWSKLNLDQIYYSYLSMLKKYEVEKYCLTLRMPAEKALHSIEVIDILHFDGNHSELSNFQDVSLYLPMVRSGGYIWFNDSLWEQSQNALDLLFGSCDVVKLIDNGNCILFKKR